MGLMKRFSMIFKSKANKALDKYEDPRETLDYSYERTLQMLQQMRRGVADVATSRKRIELQAQQLHAAGRGQGRPDAGAGGRNGRADGVRRARRPVLDLGPAPGGAGPRRRRAGGPGGAPPGARRARRAP